MTILSAIEDHLLHKSPVDAGIIMGQFFSIGITFLGFYSLIYCCRRLYITIVCKQYFDYIVRHGSIIRGEVTSKELVQGSWRVGYSLHNKRDQRWFTVTSKNSLSIGDKVNVIYFNDLLNFVVD